jgi:hypothetical protein
MMRAARPRPAKSCVTDPREDALDVLIEQYQRLYALYDARRSSAEAKAAGILTATVAVAALTATAASLVKHVNVTLAVALVVLLVLSVLGAIYAASGAGLFYRKKQAKAKLEDEVETEPPFLSTESDEYQHAVQELNATAITVLKACEHAGSKAITVRVRTLELWRARQLDAHHLARDKDRGAAGAGIALGSALVLGAIIVALIVTHPG